MELLLIMGIIVGVGWFLSTLHYDIKRNILMLLFGTALVVWIAYIVAWIIGEV
jgi:ABC-type Fe3+ transport system permease subunit